MSCLIPKNLLKNIPKLYETEDEKDPLCHIKLFTPDSNFTWYIIEISIDKLSKFLQKEAEYYFKDDIDIISSIDGISEKTACKIISEIEDINKFENFKKLIKFIGTDPVVKQSGNFKINKSVSKQGNPHLRYILFQATIGVITHNDIFKNYFKKKKSQLNSFKKAVIATLNKLVRVLFAMLKSRKKFDMKFHINNLA